MKFGDAVLLAKKILVGIVIGLVPLIILSGGLWITQKSSAKSDWKTVEAKVDSEPRTNPEQLGGKGVYA